MSFKTLEEAFESPKLTISSLRRFRKAHLQSLCEAKCIKIPQNGRRILKERYVQALFSAVRGYNVSDTRVKRILLRGLEGDALLGMTEAC